MNFLRIRSTFQRYYNIDANVYGFRRLKVYKDFEYTVQEIQNRMLNANLLRLANAYRVHGHKKSNLDPLGIIKHGPVKELQLDRYGIKPDLKHKFLGIVYSNDKQEDSAEKIVEHLERVYCGRIGYEFMHIPNASERRWFSQFIETFEFAKFKKEKKLTVLNRLIKSEVFDHFMAKRFPTVKRYGLEGAESMIVLLDYLFSNANQGGVKEIVLCMPHRGRLNFLTDLLKFDPVALFHKVKGNAEFKEGNVPFATGDVLSHIHTSVKLDYQNKNPVKVTLLPNPSHLEAVNPVAMGKARAKQMYLYEDKNLKKELEECRLGDKVMCVQLHGDAAFTGQGIVTETLGLSNLPHFTSGGSVHVIVNNQIGYTTPSVNARSTFYTSDIGKMINAPVIHVNGDHPEEVAHAAIIAYAYRDMFRKDVIIDLITYRRWGHNELDEPAFTQPMMYKAIRGHKSVPQIYQDKLAKEGVLVTEKVAEDMRTNHFDNLDSKLKDVEKYQQPEPVLTGKWADIRFPKSNAEQIPTGVEKTNLQNIGKLSVSIPEKFTVHPRLHKFHIQPRIEKLSSESKLDWATAEALAFGSLLEEGYSVRLSGQDVGRGTFSQRHAMLATFIPLNSGQAGCKIEIANSNLSEMAVLSFEYGMSLETPNRLNIWEAQFGDFFNGAQIPIDTFLTSGEAKWLRQSGLVLLLPHGYDGAGPEHSSCRIERFLQINATEVNTNLAVVNCTTPAQYFHVLRRQMKRNYRKPLVVAAPKTLLRLGACTSSLNDMAVGTSFKPVIDDDVVTNPSRILLVSGKLYYDLLNERKERNVAIVRVEEVTPFPRNAFEKLYNKYSNAEWVWVQEEPQNMGAYLFVKERIGKPLKYVGRPPIACPATGIGKRYRKEQEELLKKSFE